MGHPIGCTDNYTADILVDRFHPFFKRLALFFSYALGIAFFGIILFSGWDLAIEDFVKGHYEGEGALRVPNWPTRFTILIGSALSTLSYIVLMVLDVFAPDRYADADTLGSDAEADASHV